MVGGAAAAASAPRDRGGYVLSTEAARGEQVRGDRVAVGGQAGVARRAAPATARCRAARRVVEPGREELREGAVGEGVAARRPLAQQPGRDRRLRPPRGRQLGGAERRGDEVEVEVAGDRGRLEHGRVPAGSRRGGGRAPPQRRGAGRGGDQQRVAARCARRSSASPGLPSAPRRRRRRARPARCARRRAGGAPPVRLLRRPGTAARRRPPQRREDAGAAARRRRRRRPAASRAGERLAGRGRRRGRGGRGRARARQGGGGKGGHVRLGAGTRSVSSPAWGGERDELVAAASQRSSAAATGSWPRSPPSTKTAAPARPWRRGGGPARSCRCRRRP